MSATGSKSIKLVPAPLDLDQLGHFTERDVGQTVRIRIYPIHACPTDARLCNVDGLAVPLFEIDEVAAKKLLASVRLKDRAHAAAAFLVEIQQAISDLRSELSDIAEDHRAELREKDDLKVLQQKVLDEGRKRGPKNTQIKRFEAVRDAAEKLRETLNFLSSLDRIAMEDTTYFSRPRLAAISRLLSSMSEAFGKPQEPETASQGAGAPSQHPHERRFVNQLAMHYYNYVGKPSRTGGSPAKGYASPFERYVRSVIEVSRSKGIEINHNIRYLTGIAAAHIRILVGEDQSDGTA